MKINLLLFMIVVLSKAYTQPTPCSNYVSSTSKMMKDFTFNAYNPMIIKYTYPYLGILSHYLIQSIYYCNRKKIDDPDSLYPRDVSQCMLKLYQASLLTATYTGNYGKIQNQLDPIIAKVVFSAGSNCRPVMAYTGWTNVTNECIDYIKSLDELLKKYNDDITLGGDGFKFINSMILAAQKARKSCGFDILVKPKAWEKDTCTAANNQSLYPLSRDLSEFLNKYNLKSFIQGFYTFYQTIYRVKAVCGIINEDRKQLSSE